MNTSDNKKRVPESITDGSLAFAMSSIVSFAAAQDDVKVFGADEEGKKTSLLILLIGATFLAAQAGHISPAKLLETFLRSLERFSYRPESETLRGEIFGGKKSN